MKGAILVVVSLIIQRALALPGLPPVLALVLIPMVWIVALALTQRERPLVYPAIVVGLGWDLLLEPVVGPGGISWSVTALAASIIATIVADRSPKAWAALGAFGTILVTLTRYLTLLPLGLATPLSLRQVLLSALLTAGWCGFVGWILALDLPTRWRRHRARVLR